MKLYIPTSSLNFNNILSTESISPKDFYEERGFGYSRWHTIPENDIPSVILLYEDPHLFARPMSDMEDHPLLVEYVSNEIFPPCEDGIHYTDKTIYLDPWHTRFIFFSENDMRVTLSLSDSSLETKLLRLYRKKVIVSTSMSLDGQYPIINTSKLNIPTNTEQIGFDRKVNKMKGLLYGYYIGAYLSMSDEQLLTKMNILREISNIFASVVSSIDKIPSTMQMERLSTLFAFMLKDDPIYNGLKGIIGDESKTNAVVEFLEKNHLPIFSENWRNLVNGMRYNSKGEEHAISWLNSELDKLNKKALKKRSPLSVDKEEIITTDCQLNSLSEYVVEDATLRLIYKAWINEVLGTNEYNGKISPIKGPLSDALTIKAKELLGDKWQESEIQTFMNQLRRHIRGEEFNPQWDNGILSSIASCLIKGDDWEPLLLFMQSKGMTDYRLAFSFYGVLNGFANLTRDFTDNLLELDSGYVAEVYKEFAGQLLGIDITETEQGNNATIQMLPSSDSQEKSSQAPHKRIKGLKSLMSKDKEKRKKGKPTPKKNEANEQQMELFSNQSDVKNIVSNVPSLKCTLIPFTIDNTDIIISKIKMRLHLNSDVIKELTKDLKYSFKNRSGKTAQFDYFLYLINVSNWKNNPKMIWKIHLYENLDYTMIKQIISDTCDTNDR